MRSPDVNVHAHARTRRLARTRTQTHTDANEHAPHTHMLTPGPLQVALYQGGSPLYIIARSLSTISRRINIGSAPVHFYGTCNDGTTGEASRPILCHECAGTRSQPRSPTQNRIHTRVRAHTYTHTHTHVHTNSESTHAPLARCRCVRYKNTTAIHLPRTCRLLLVVPFWLLL